MFDFYDILIVLCLKALKFDFLMLEISNYEVLNSLFVNQFM